MEEKMYRLTNVRHILHHLEGQKNEIIKIQEENKYKKKEERDKIMAKLLKKHEKENRYFRNF